MKLFIDPPRQVSDHRVWDQSFPPPRKAGPDSPASFQSHAPTSDPSTTGELDLDEVDASVSQPAKGGRRTRSRPRDKRAVRREVAERVVAPYSTVQEAYRDDLAYGKERDRARKRAHILRVLAVIVVFPIVLALVFIAAYALTCIVNGATPQELVEMMGDLFHRVGAFAGSLVSASSLGG